METLKQSVLRKQKIEEQHFIAFAKENDITNFKFTHTECPYDVKMKSGSTFFMSELKVRSDRNLSYFEKYGPYLELKKIEGMWREREKIVDGGITNIKMLYINFAIDGYQVFNLEEPWKYKFEWRLLPKNNYEPGILIWKLVAELFTPILTKRNYVHIYNKE